MSELHVRISLRAADDILDLVAQKEIGQDHLNLVRRKESTRTSVAPIAKGETVLANAHKLVESRPFHRTTGFGVLSESVKS